ncbi:MAG: hypothetical protein Fur0037_19180 [Planctomycetota bacterium]
MASPIRTILLAAALCAGLPAQVACYESNYGPSLGTGDDVIFPIQPIGFSFPFAGQTYTDVFICTNGYFFLSNAGTPPAGTAYMYTGSPSTLVNSVAPMISPFGHDLNVTAANNGGVHVASFTNPNRFVITWQNVVEYGHTTLLTVQCQLSDTGQIGFFYSANTSVAGSTDLTGFSPGNGAIDPGAVDLTTNPSTAVPTVYELFDSVSLPFDIQGRSTLFTPNAAGGFDVDTNTCVGAAHTSYGSGCIFGAVSFYEAFGPGTFDLGVPAPAVNSVLLTPQGGGYLVTPGSANWFTHTLPGLGLGDDAQAPLALPSAFAYPGGSTTSLAVCSNGFLWLQPDPSTDFSPTPAELLGQTARLAPIWADLVPNATNDVYAEVDASTNTAYVTWDSVPTFASGGRVRVQVAIDLSAMTVEYRYQDCLLPGSSCVVGWSPGGGAPDPGNRDISMSMPFTTVPDSSPLRLDASPAPVAGSTVTWTTSNIPAAALLSSHVISFAPVIPAFDLSVIGAPGCFQHASLVVGTAPFIFGSPTATFTLAIPSSSSWLGAHLYCQSVSLVPGINAASLITSNGVDSRISSF